MQKAHGFDTPESLYGLHGEDLDVFLSEMKTSAAPAPEAPSVQAQAEQTTPNEEVVARLGEPAVGGCVQIHDNQGFYKHYEQD